MKTNASTKIQTEFHPQRLYNVLLAPCISEKAVALADAQRQFVFKIANDATKPEVKKAVETLFDVKVESVRVCRKLGRLKGRLQRHQTTTKEWKKAYVTLKDGFDIDFAKFSS